MWTVGLGVGPSYFMFKSIVLAQAAERDEPPRLEHLNFKLNKVGVRASVTLRLAVFKFAFKSIVLVLLLAQARLNHGPLSWKLCISGRHGCVNLNTPRPISTSACTRTLTAAMHAWGSSCDGDWCATIGLGHSARLLRNRHV